MSDNQNTVEVSNGQVKVNVAVRNAPIPLSELLPKLIKFAAEGKTVRETAEALGMKETSLNVRMTSIRKLKDSKGNVVGPQLLPTFKGAAKGRKTDVDSIMALVEAAKAQAESDAADAEDESDQGWSK